MSEPARVIVVGSLNLDLVAEVARLPRRGETLLAEGHSRALGGKGANQAVSAVRHGVGVAMIGCVGADAEGRRLADALADEGIDVSGIRVRDDAATGAAHITVDPEGSNTIVVIPAANGMLSAADVRRELRRLPAPDVLLVQLEIPLDAVQEATSGTEARVVLNPAPARSLPSELVRQVDVLVPNVPELGALTGGDAPRTLEDITARGRRLADGRAVVITMGEEGALVIDGDRTTHVPAPRVDAVDTTGAGDAFCGSLAAGLAAGSSLVDAASDAVRVASRSTLRRGALEAIPTTDEIGDLIASELGDRDEAEVHDHRSRTPRRGEQHGVRDILG
jgi:ribokinase